MTTKPCAKGALGPGWARLVYAANITPQPTAATSTHHQALIREFPNAAVPQQKNMSKNGVLPSGVEVVETPTLKENAMKTLRFVVKFTKLIAAVLSCFDRVIFCGYLPDTNGPARRLRRLRPQDPVV